MRAASLRFTLQVQHVQHNSMRKCTSSAPAVLSRPRGDLVVAISRRDLAPRSQPRRAISRRAISRRELISVRLLLLEAVRGVGVTPRVDLRRPRRVEPCTVRPHACHHLVGVRLGVGVGVGIRVGVGVGVAVAVAVGLTR